jgi:hypothetical protein
MDMTASIKKHQDKIVEVLQGSESKYKAIKEGAWSPEMGVDEKTYRTVKNCISDIKVEIDVTAQHNTGPGKSMETKREAIRLTYVHNQALNARLDQP